MNNKSLRRGILKAAGTAAVGVAAAAATSARAQTPEAAPARPEARSFPAGFLWGTATAAYQVEGAVNEDGRGPSIWDLYTHDPATVSDGSNGDVAVDHYHRSREDIALMKAMGTTAYRFSIAWPRVFPRGTGSPNPEGLDFYSRLVDDLLAAGIQPFATLYHWDLPEALQDRFGGWQSRDTAHAFADYAGYVAGRLGERIRHFSPMNEIGIFTGEGYGRGRQAPGLKLPRRQVNQVRHHALLGHGLGVAAIRAAAGSGVQIGPAENMITAAPVIETAENIHAAEAATREINAAGLTAMLEGRYTERFLEGEGADAPVFTDADLKAIGTPCDFIGVNIYAINRYVRAADTPPGYTEVPYQDSHPAARYQGGDVWIRMSPESMYWPPRILASLWGVRDIFITENGCPFGRDLPAGQVDEDTDRIMWTRAYLAELQRATADGAPIRGYFHWTLLDNFEWAFGFGPRFGLHAVDRKTLARTPKLSAAYYGEVIRGNRLA